MMLRIPAGHNPAQVLALWRSLARYLDKGSPEAELLAALIETNQPRPGWDARRREGQRQRRAQRTRERLVQIRQRCCRTCGVRLVAAKRASRQYCSPLCAKLWRRLKAASPEQRAAYMRTYHPDKEVDTTASIAARRGQ